MDLHGVQCAVATLQAVKLYEFVKNVKPDAAKAAAYVEAFSYEKWQEQLKGFLGNSAETMIALEARERKYNKENHPARFAKIADNWNAIVDILNEELPSNAELEGILQTIGISADLKDLDVNSETAQLTFQATKDIRDKYVLSRLAWDLGIMDELCQML